MLPFFIFYVQGPDKSVYFSKLLFVITPEILIWSKISLEPYKFLTEVLSLDSER